MKKKLKKRNPLAGVLAQPCFKKQVVRDKTKYTRKGRAVHVNRDGSFSM